MKPIPVGMVAVSKEQFFQALYADARDIMPSANDPECTRWETRNRQLWGWSSPGWKNPNGEKTYAIYPKSQEAQS